MMMNSSVAPGQYDTPECHFCGQLVFSNKDGRMWVNGMRICMPCAEGEQHRKKYVVKRYLPHNKNHKKKAA